MQRYSKLHITMENSTTASHENFSNSFADGQGKYFYNVIM